MYKLLNYLTNLELAVITRTTLLDKIKWYITAGQMGSTCKVGISLEWANFTVRVGWVKSCAVRAEQAVNAGLTISSRADRGQPVHFHFTGVL